MQGLLHNAENTSQQMHEAEVIKLGRRKFKHSNYTCRLCNLAQITRTLCLSSLTYKWKLTVLVLRNLSEVKEDIRHLFSTVPDMKYIPDTQFFYLKCIVNKRFLFAKSLN